MNRVPDELKNAFSQHGDRRLAGENQYDLLGNQLGRLDWRRLLRRYAGQILQVRPTLSRPSGDFPNWWALCRGRPSGRIAAGHGSHRHIWLHHAGVTGVDKRRAGVVDAAPYGHRWSSATKLSTPSTRYQTSPRAVHGCGGTDLRPPLARKFLRKHRPDLIVVLYRWLRASATASPTGSLGLVAWCQAGSDPPGMGTGNSDARTNTANNGEKRHVQTPNNTISGPEKASLYEKIGFGTKKQHSGTKTGADFGLLQWCR